MAGMIRSLYPLATAMAAAEDGPPRLALDETVSSSMGSLKILPTPMVNRMLMAAMMPQNRKSSGAFLMTLHRSAGQPMTTKKM